MTRECYYCGYPNRDDAARCINCGLELNKYWDKSNGKIELINIKKIVEYNIKNIKIGFGNSLEFP